MKFRRHYLKEHPFALTILPQKFDNKDLWDHVNQFNRDTEGWKNLRELADASGVLNIDLLSVKGTVDASRAEAHRPDSILAILIPESNVLIFGLARSYQALAAKRRKAVKIFTDLNEALEWLTNNENECKQFAEFVKRCTPSR